MFGLREVEGREVKYFKVLITTYVWIFNEKKVKTEMKGTRLSLYFSPKLNGFGETVSVHVCITFKAYLQINYDSKSVETI